MQSKFDNNEDYIDALNGLISEYHGLQYLICASMSAALMTVLNLKCNMSLHSYILNVVGNYESGKEAASRLCASMWTAPDSKAISDSMHSTANTFYKKLDGRYGIPTFRHADVITGDLSAKDIGYTVYEGCEKERMTANCTLRESAEWNTIVVVTSQEYFRDAGIMRNAEQVIHIHTADNLTFVDGIHHADDITEFTSSNYGVIGKLFVEYLLRISDTELKNDYNSALSIMCSITHSDNNTYTERLCAVYALIFQTADILSSMGLDIIPDNVANIMKVQHTAVFQAHDHSSFAMQAITEYVMQHLTDSGIRTFPNESRNTVQAAAIPVGKTESILKSAGFKDPHTIIRELDRKGYLIRQGNGARNGLQSDLRINGIQTKCYKFKLNAHSQDEEDD